MSNAPKCDICNDTGAVCEHHRHLPWENEDGTTCCDGCGKPCVCGQSPFSDVVASVNQEEVTRTIQ